jgi:phage-related protein
VRESEWKPVWVGTSLKDLKAFPREVQRVMGFAIYAAEQGGRHPDARPLKGFGGASVLEMVEDHDGETYRAVYTVRFADAVYVLHAFQKKSSKGIATPKHEMELIRARLRDAEAIHEERSKEAAHERTPQLHGKQRKRLR